MNFYLLIVFSVCVRVMVNLDCQLEYNWNYLGSKLQGMPLKDFLNKMTETDSNLGHTFWWQLRYNMEEGNHFFSLLLLTLAGKFISPTAAVSIKSNFFRIPLQTKDQPLSRNPLGL